MSAPGRPKLKSDKRKPVAMPSVGRLTGAYILAGVSAVLSFAMVVWLFTAKSPGSLVFLPIVPIIVFAASALYLASVIDVLSALEPLGYIAIQRGLHLGWATGVLAAVGWATLPFWWKAQGPSSVLIVLLPLCIGLSLTAAYGFIVRLQADHPAFPGLVEDPAVYRKNVARVLFLGIVGCAILCLGALLSQSGKHGADTVSQVILWPGLILWIAAVIAAHVHIPYYLAILAKSMLDRALEQEGVFFLGEPLKRGQTIIEGAYKEIPAAAREPESARDRGILKVHLKQRLTNVPGLDVSTAKIPVPGKLNLRTGEKEVHKYIQVSVPVHAGTVKAFISARPIGEHLVLSYSLYYLGESSPRTLYVNAPKIIAMYFAARYGAGAQSKAPERTWGSDDALLVVPPKLKAGSEMDSLMRADRDEIVDEIAGVLWLGVFQALEEFKTGFAFRRTAYADATMEVE